MWKREKGGVTNFHTDTGHDRDVAHKFVAKDFSRKRKNFGVESGTTIVDLDNFKTVGERHNVQTFQQSGLTWSDTFTFNDKSNIIDDFNQTTGNFGSNVKSLEKTGLSRVHTSVSGGDNDIAGSPGTGTGGGGDDVVNHNVFDFAKITVVGKDKSDVAVQVSHQ